MANKQPIQKFSSNQWQIYLKSKIYFSFLLVLKTDLNQIKPYFKEVHKRITEFFQKNPS